MDTDIALEVAELAFVMRAGKEVHAMSLIATTVAENTENALDPMCALVMKVSVDLCVISVLIQRLAITVKRA